MVFCHGMPKMLQVLMSRERPKRLASALRSFINTRTFAEVLVILDGDDPTIQESAYEVSSIAEEHQGVVHLEVSPEAEGLAKGFNRVCCAKAPAYDVLGLAADDLEFKTNGWDKIFYDDLAAVNFFGVVYGDDKIQGQRLPTHPCFGSVIPKAIGRVCAPGLRHLYIDSGLASIGKALGHLSYIPEVVIEHLHYSVHPEFADQGYHQRNTKEMYRHDMREHRRWEREQLAHDVETIKRFKEARP